MQDGPRILVAAALGKIIEPILRQSLPDAKVRIAEDKDAVLRAIGDRLRFDVAVTDLTWMDYAVEYSFDGLDVLDALRHAGRQTPVIFAAQSQDLKMTPEIVYRWCGEHAPYILSWCRRNGYSDIATRMTAPPADDRGPDAPPG